MPPFAKLNLAYVVNSGDQLPVSRFLVLGKSPEVNAWSPQQDFWATCCEDPPEESVVLVVRQIPSRSPRDLWPRLKGSLATFLFKPGFSFEDEPDVKSHLHVDSSRNGRPPRGRRAAHGKRPPAAAPARAAGGARAAGWARRVMPQIWQVRDARMLKEQK